MARDHQQMNKPRNSNRPMNNRNSRQEGPSMSNESLDYGAHSTPQYVYFIFYPLKHK